MTTTTTNNNAPKLVGAVHTFNTGRQYAADGQRITWALIEQPEGKYRRVVAFIDHARGIEGAIPLFFGNLDLLNDRWLLRAYDDMHYTHDYAAIEFLRAELRGKAVQS